MTIHYYLAYGDIKGSIATDNVTGTFAIDEFSFGGSVDVNLTAAAGSEVSSPDFSEITLTLGNQSGIPNFFQEAAAGKGQSVSIIGIDDQANQVMEIKLDNVLLSGLFDNTEGFSLTLNYAQIEVDTTFLDSQGDLQLPDPVFGWDRATDLPGTATGQAPAGSAGLTTAPSKYFLLIDGVNGGSKDPGHLGWFEITSFDNALARNIPGFSGGNREASTAFFPSSTSLSPATRRSPPC